ncbi:GLPGLI family protein [Chryseobacterium sp. L7]|uniref:GLPGLI family protein n=1 Tax=Chryseobacterium endalhagicum TaxID=2797638 RepID=A0ABS1QJ90_9FLAO|nr:GLPGLI family protein [Chryseobacterium endalhagicum]MBL1222129.1 GLPGLI family protein [Chryseobacterium endalhagicum]
MYNLFFLLLISLVSGQSYRFVYEYKMIPDTTRKDSLVINYMNLDSDGKKSFFYNSTKYEADSTYNSSKDFGAILKTERYDHNLIYVVEKDYSLQEIKFYTKFASAGLVMIDSEIPKWKLEKEFEKINNMNCQKASLKNYKGRDWEAWFTAYPLSDGPYKFYGLPGLIIQLSDSKKEHIFNLIKTKKIHSVFSLLPKNSKVVTQMEYEKLIKNKNFNFDRDVESFTADVKAGKVGVIMKNGYAADFNYNDLKKSSKTGKIDDEIAKRLKATSNPIEISAD